MTVIRIELRLQTGWRILRHSVPRIKVKKAIEGRSVGWDRRWRAEGNAHLVQVVGSHPRIITCKKKKSCCCFQSVAEIWKEGEEGGGHVLSEQEDARRASELHVSEDGTLKCAQDQASKKATNSSLEKGENDASRTGRKIGADKERYSIGGDGAISDRRL